MVAEATRPGTRIVTRGTGVYHLYRGPLTPSNRYAPRSCSTVCNTRTRQLRVCDPLPVAREFAVPAPAQRPCVRCSACLVAAPAAGQATPTRSQAVEVWGHLTVVDLLMFTHLAATAEEVAWVAWIGLVVVGVPGCRVEVVGPDGRRHRSLHQLLEDARIRVGVHAEERAARREAEAAAGAAAVEAELARRRDDWAEREAVIERLGISIAQPHRPRNNP